MHEAGRGWEIELDHGVTVAIWEDGDLEIDGNEYYGIYRLPEPLATAWLTALASQPGAIEVASPPKNTQAADPHDGGMARP